MAASNPQRIICFSGKRKSGKDYVTELLHRKYTASCIFMVFLDDRESIFPRLCDSVVIRLSAPIKQHWADSLSLDLKELLGDGLYKEEHRAEMIAWGEMERARDPGVFCRSAIEMSNGKDTSLMVQPTHNVNHHFLVLISHRRRLFRLDRCGYEEKDGPAILPG